MGRKREYHNLVSPRVRRGGLSSLIHNKIRKSNKTAVPVITKILPGHSDFLFLPEIEIKVTPIIHKIIVIPPKYGKLIQFIFLLFNRNRVPGAGIEAALVHRSGERQR